MIPNGLMAFFSRISFSSFPGFKIIWDGVSFLELSVEPHFAGRLCGLCGNFNGDPHDDFRSRSGRAISAATSGGGGSHANQLSNRLSADGQRFGDAWRVGGLKACSVLPQDMPRSYEPHCTQTWASRIASDRNCNALNSTLFERCAKLVETAYYHNACKLDMCECPGDQCHCEVLTAYARECERAGVLVHNWRAATGCENVTSFRWADKSQIYKLKVSDLASRKNDVVAKAAAEGRRSEAKPVYTRSRGGTGGSGRREKERQKKKKKDGLGDYLPGMWMNR